MACEGVIYMKVLCDERNLKEKTLEGLNDWGEP